MFLIAVLSLALYPLFVVSTFVFTTTTRAVFISYLVAWLYLPNLTFDVPGLPNYGKFTATNLSILPCLLLFAVPNIVRIRFHIADLAVLLWIVAPMATSLSNQLGVYDGLSGVMSQVLTYGIPYLAGKASLQSRRDWAEFLQFLILAGLSYIPLVIYETRMSPTFHLLVYGVSGRATYEYSGLFGPFGWQPTVFMNSAFEVSMMFVMCTLAAFSMQKNALPTWLMPYQSKLPWVFVFAVLICKKWSAMGLLAVALLTLQIRTRIALMFLLLVPILYMGVFISGIYRGEGLSDHIAGYSERRAESFETRVVNDNRLVQKALERPWLGWGGWGRNRVYNEDGRDITITDSLWMIVLGMNGLLGLCSQTAMFLFPSIGFALQRFSRNSYRDDFLARVGYSVTLLLGLHQIDNLFNAFPNSMYPLMAGGLTSLIALARRASPDT